MRDMGYELGLGLELGLVQAFILTTSTTSANTTTTLTLKYCSCIDHNSFTASKSAIHNLSHWALFIRANT